MSKKPRILICTGDGKGKTTAALGMVLRAMGHGMRAAFLQFMKNDDATGEIRALRRFRNCCLLQMGRGFVPKPGSPAFEKHREAAQKALDEAARRIGSSRWQLVVLDELCTALSVRLLDEDEVLRILKKARGPECLVLTGRGASRRLMGLADTVTEMRCIKHGMRTGWKAQKGVEF
ncbi:MAG: cob(I)yrinic acid a,c-diamide adenosyltransferase [Verrucomicrobiae bacterium]|nr:cob(I)yrinic acid a,c-diamide adenosyltransferase [Verrucomicrobiae bacterium]